MQHEDGDRMDGAGVGPAGGADGGGVGGSESWAGAGEDAYAYAGSDAEGLTPGEGEGDDIYDIAYEHDVTPETAAEIVQLVQDFPQLANPEIAGQLHEVARAAAEDVGAPQLADDPMFLRMTMLAAQGHARLDGQQEEPIDAATNIILGRDGGFGNSILPYVGGIQGGSDNPPASDLAAAILRTDAPGSSILPF